MKMRSGILQTYHFPSFLTVVVKIPALSLVHTREERESEYNYIIQKRRYLFYIDGTLARPLAGLATTQPRRTRRPVCYLGPDIEPLIKTQLFRHPVVNYQLRKPPQTTLNLLVHSLQRIVDISTEPYGVGGLLAPPTRGSRSSPAHGDKTREGGVISQRGEWRWIHQLCIAPEGAGIGVSRTNTIEL